MNLVKRAAKRHTQSAFSLVEVTLALGVATFCMVAILGLLPVGLKSNQSAIEQTMAASIARSIATDLRLTPILSGSSPQFGFTFSGSSGAVQSLYFSEDGSPTGKVGDAPLTSGTTSRYRTSIWIVPPASATKAATSVRLMVTWPALADSNPASNPSNFSGSFEILTALDRN
jgi:uncharacterized protein (TIGR02598 family)